MWLRNSSVFLHAKHNKSHVEELSIVKVFLPGDRGRNRGFALITYSTVEEAEEAMEKFERFSLNHLLLSVEWSENKKRF